MAVIEIGFELRQCPSCGISYQAPSVYMEECRKNPAQYFYCPAGHGRHFSESEADKLRRERDQLKQRASMLEEQASEASKRADKAEAATKRLKKRTAAGTCPCCQRTFSNMSEHMKHQHPQFICDTGAKVVPIKRGVSA